MMLNLRKMLSLKKILFLILNLITIINCQTYDKKSKLFCRCKLPVSSRIVGGENVNGYIPFFASLAYNSRHICGSVIVNEYFLLTAAHCVEKKLTETNHLSIRVGINRLDDPEIDKKTYEIDSVFIHPEFSNISLPGDLAVLKTFRPIKFIKNLVEPACLSLEKKDQSYSNLHAVGFGSEKKSYLDDNGKLVVFESSNNLKKIELIEVLDDYEEHIISVDQVKIGESICNGDSGGNLNHFESNGKVSVVGLASYVHGFKSNKNYYFCKGPAGFSRLSFYRDFITELIDSICEI